MPQETIDVETVEPTAAPAQTMAVARREQMEVGKALTVEELHQRLEFVRQVMRNEMREGTDYGKIPGTGDKPSLLQPGAQKLLMTFNLRAQVLREVLREIPHRTVAGHREYEFTLRIFPSGGDPETQGTDGVGTCSTFESKYRYRKAERKCPSCGKPAIIAGKEEYGGGFLCWKKKSGCGAKFESDDGRITGQPADDVENEDPADQWNTVRKMGFKRALVAGVINYTNTSELWTQDVEDMAGNQPPQHHKAPPQQSGRPPQTPPQRPPAASAPPPPPPQQKPTAQAKDLKLATAATRNWMVRELEPYRELATEYFQKLSEPAVLMPSEKLEDLPLEWIPISTAQLKALKDQITEFGNGAEPRHAFKANPVDPANAQQAKPRPRPPQAAAPPSVAAAKKRDPEYFWDVICPIPRKGEKKADYDKKPDTIGSLYSAMKAGDEAAQKRLWGFARNWKPEPRTVGDRTYPVSQADLVFREALDAFCDWEEKHGKDTVANAGNWAYAPQQELPADEDDVPF
jgi:hypothetical protein